MKFFLDASAIIEWEHGNPKAVDKIEKSEGVGVGSIAAYEVLVGLTRNKRSKVIEFLNRYPPEQFNVADSFTAAEITDALAKAGKMVNTLDIMIAAQAKRLNLTILAKDKDFDVISKVYPGAPVIQIDWPAFGTLKGVGPFTKEDELDEH
jgi:predicted nucleic acid-binding protein